MSTKQQTILYCNQPVYEVDGRFYTDHANYVDFLAEWTRTDPFSELVLPVRIASIVKDKWIEIYFRKGAVHRVKPYRRHVSAVFWGAYNFFRFRKIVKRLSRNPEIKTRCVIPGPNTFSTLFSLFGLKNVTVGVVVRGDGRKTLDGMYSGSLLQPIVLALFSFYRKRVVFLQKQGATVFCFGRQLQLQYQPFGASKQISPLIGSYVVEKVGALSKSNQRSNRVRFLYVGRLSREKGILELLSAFTKLLECRHDAELNIVGKGPLSVQVEDLITKLNSTNISFHGAAEPGLGVLSYMLKSDCLLVPSKTEGVPRVIVEAALANLPVLSTAVGGIPDAFGQSIDYFSSPSVDDIYDGLMRHMETRQNQVSNRSRQIDLTPFLFSKNVELISDTL